MNHSMADLELLSVPSQYFKTCFFKRADEWRENKIKPGNHVMEIYGVIVT